MGLFLPIPGTTAGPQWATETTANWSTLDTHDHTTGKGVQIPIAALNVNADFSWLTFGQTNVGYLSLVDKLATGNLTVNASLGNVAGDPYWRNAAGVVKKIGLAGDQLASGTALLGSLLMTAIAAPGSPTAGFGSFYFDSTATNIAVKNSAGVVKHGVQTKAAVGSQWLTSIADDGSSVLAQPAFSDISGSIVSGTGAAGSLLFTNIVAPGTPAAGKVSLWTDSTTKAPSAIDDAGKVYAMPRINSGSTAGRSGQPVLIDDVTLSAVTTYASPSWTAGLYQKLTFELTVSTGGGVATVSLTGLSGAAYSSVIFTSDGVSLLVAATATWQASPTAPGFFNGSIVCSNGRPRTFEGTGWIGTTPYHQRVAGVYNDTTHDVTQLTMSISSATTGRMRLWGVPT
jgi:hypothetical protein